MLKPTKLILWFLMSLYIVVRPMIAFAIPGVDGAVLSNPDDVKIDVEQYISLSFGVQRAPGIVDVTDKNNTVSTTTGLDWFVFSNNAIKIVFSGTSKKDDGTQPDNAYPLFTKADIAADGTVIANSFDHLDTTFNASISNHQGTSGQDSTGALAADVFVDQADDLLGSVMPENTDTNVYIGLEAIGTWDLSNQSGNYWAEVTITIVGDEKEHFGANPHSK